jgi:hypothetical protein
MDEAQRAAWLVRQSPPPATLAWLVDELEASACLEVSVMQGGLTAAMHRVTVLDRDGRERHVVLRRYVRDEILSESPDVASIEARVLQLAERLAVPTPTLLAFDERGDRADVPALVMSPRGQAGVGDPVGLELGFPSRRRDDRAPRHRSIRRRPAAAHDIRPEALRPATMDD